MQKVTELTSPPIVGKMYLVPCAKVKIREVFCGEEYERSPFWTERPIPLLGDFHWDKEIINFPDEHAHIDFRFVSYQEINRIVGSPLAQVISRQNVVDLRWMVRKCCGKGISFPPQSPERHVPWFPPFEAAYADKRVQCGKCPHRGIDLNPIEPDSQGNKVCPAHGLKWSDRGCLVKQVI